jgi:hypothetical protein
MRIAVIGPKKMVYPPRKARNFCDEANIFHYTVVSDAVLASNIKFDESWAIATTA